MARGQLRLYEDDGLISPQSRTDTGYRQYGADTLNRLKGIMHLKELAFTLAEIALLLIDRDKGELDAQAMGIAAVRAITQGLLPVLVTLTTTLDRQSQHLANTT